MKKFSLIPLSLAVLITIFSRNSQDSLFHMDSISDVIDDSRKIQGQVEGIGEVLTPSSEGARLLSCKVQRGDTWLSVLKRFTVSSEDSKKMLAFLNRYSLKSGAVVFYDPKSHSLQIPLGLEKLVLLQKNAQGLYHLNETIRVLKKERRYLYGGIQSSFYQTLIQKGLPPALIFKVIKHLSHVVNFQHGIQVNDPFEILYEVYTDQQGRPVRFGDVHYIGLFTKGKIHQLYRFDDEFFDANGQSSKRSLLSTPLSPRHMRITSHFQKNRHLNGYCRDHKGIDYGAPHGAEVVAAGSGVVTKSGYQGAYGNMVEIRHAGGYQTRYAHLSKLAVRAGNQVKQGDWIGNVGSTGRSTGAHLHFETIVHGVHKNPLHIKQTPNLKLAGKQFSKFQSTKRSIEAQIVGMPRLLASKGRSVD